MLKTSQVLGRLFTRIILTAVIMALIGFLSGCGSDSTSVSETKDKTSKVKPLADKLGPQKGPAPKNKSQAGTNLSLQTFGLTPEALEASKEAAAKIDPKLEIAPGLTVEQLRARQAEAAQKMTDPSMEIFPKVYRGDIKPKLGTQILDNPNIEVLPGITLQQAKAKQAAAVQENVDPRKIFPPIQKDKSKQ